jgi:malate/lactate dehydrogenase/NAD-dependent SIR2 family protein deacetylase
MSSNHVSVVFVISPGRSGTAFCSDLFGAARDVVVEHEPLPVCAAAPMRLFNAGRVDAMRALAASKWRAIELRRRSCAACTTYVETNAQFVKGFGWPLLASLDAAQLSAVGVLHLHRDTDLVAASFVANGEAPSFTAFADVWNIAPGAAAAIVPSAASAMTPLEAIRWQIDEIDARAAELRRRFPTARWHSATLAELNTRAGAVAALAAFGLSPRDDAALDGVLTRGAVNSGAERAHAPRFANDAVAARALSPRHWPHRAMVDNVAAVEALCDRVLARAGAAERVRAQRRPLLGIGQSCMVGAKAELGAAELGVSLAFSELQFQLICSLCARVEPDDVLFSFVRRVGGVWQLCNRINGSTAATRSAHVMVRERQSSKPFVLVVVGGAGQLAPPMLAALVGASHTWLPVSCRQLHVRLVTRASSSVRRAEGIAADLADAAAALELTTRVFADSQLESAFADGADLTLLLASAPRELFDQRRDLAARNTPLYERIADALVRTAGPIVVVANPVHTLASVLCRCQPSLAGRVTSLMHIDAMRAAGAIAALLHVPPCDIVGVVAVGNHSHNVHIDTSAACVRLADSGGMCLLDDCLTSDELGARTTQRIHERAASIIELTGHTALLSVARAVVAHVACVLGADDGDGDGDELITSMGVFIDTARWRAERRTFAGAACLPRPLLTIDDVWPFARDFRGVFGMPVRRGGAIDWMAWVTAIRSPVARERVAASLAELADAVAAPLTRSPLLRAEFERARAALHSSDANILVLAGAGLSADVIPDLLRFDEQFAALPPRGLPTIFHVSNHEHFLRDPASAWGFFAHRAVSYGRAPSSPATAALARFLATRGAASWFVETTNLDCQLMRAGVSRVFERHGTLFDVQCVSTECGAPVVRRAVEWFEALCSDASALMVPSDRVPRCGECGSVQRIATALAVDASPFRKTLQGAQRAQRDRFMEQTLRAAAPFVILEVGVGVQMPKLRARAAAIKAARRGLGLRTVHIRVNKLHHAHTPRLDDDLSLPVSAGDAFDELVLPRSSEER